MESLQQKRIKPKRSAYIQELPNPNHKITEHMKFKDAMNILLDQRSYVCASRKVRYQIYAELRKMKISCVVDEISYTSGQSLLRFYNVKHKAGLYVNLIRSGRLSREELLKHVTVVGRHKLGGGFEQFDYDLVLAKIKIDEICKVKCYHDVLKLLWELCYLALADGCGNLDDFLKYGWITQCELCTFVKRITICGKRLQQEIVKIILRESNIQFHFI